VQEVATEVVTEVAVTTATAAVTVGKAAANPAETSWPSTSHRHLTAATGRDQIAKMQ
jgi:hypothetical protein